MDSRICHTLPASPAEPGGSLRTSARCVYNGSLHSGWSWRFWESGVSPECPRTARRTPVLAFDHEGSNALPFPIDFAVYLRR